MNVHLYADDTQLYIAFEPLEGAVAVDQMMECVEEIRNWMEANMLNVVKWGQDRVCHHLIKV